MTCPFGRSECHGPSGLYLGLLACWSCYRDAPESAVEVMDEWSDTNE